MGLVQSLAIRLFLTLVFGNLFTNILFQMFVLFPDEMLTQKLYNFHLIFQIRPLIKLN